MLMLNKKFASTDRAKSSFGYIGIISLSILFGSLFLNDFVRVIRCLYFKCIRSLQVKDNEQNISARESNWDFISSNQISLEIERSYSSYLDNRLERVHKHLIQVVHLETQLKIYTIINKSQIANSFILNI